MLLFPGKVTGLDVCTIYAFLGSTFNLVIKKKMLGVGIDKNESSGKLKTNYLNHWHKTDPFLTPYD